LPQFHWAEKNNNKRVVTGRPDVFRKRFFLQKAVIAFALFPNPKFQQIEN
jgi:hypothetical protein